MDEIQLLVRVMAGLAVVATAVLIVLAYSVLGVMKSARRLEERVNRLLDTWEPVAAETRAAVADFTEQSGELLSRLNALSALLHKQALRADSLMNSLATSAERNIDEVQSAVSNTLGRVNAAADSLDRAVRAPIAQLRGLAAGIAAALRQFNRGRATSPERISTDEEMFI